MTVIRAQACEACPYRRDVPSGVWEAHEYDKLRAYDLPTGDQPMATFYCHASPQAMCHGWAVVHTSRGHEFDLLALRLWGSPPIPPPSVPLFNNGNEAADHGQRDANAPLEDATKMMDRLLRKHPRLRGEP